MTKRKITAHKGDESGRRSERFAGRCTKRIKWMAGEIKRLADISVADLHAEIVQARYQEIIDSRGEQNATDR